MGKKQLNRVRRVHPLVKQLAERRASLGLTQADAAELIGVSRTAVSYWECGMTDPETTSLELYANAVGLQVTLALKTP